MKTALTVITLLALAWPSSAGPIAVICHRGDHTKYPENTMGAFQAAITEGADFIEVDVQTTADGHLVLMHDSKVDRTTNGSGEIKNLTFSQVEALDVGIKTGPQFGGMRVPTFDQALELASGKIGIYVDTKNASAEDVVAALKKYDMQDHVVVYGRGSYLKAVQQIAPNVKVMPEARSSEVLTTLIQDMHPKVIAYTDGDFDNSTIRLAKAAGAEIYVDRMGAQDCPDFWSDAIERGASGIQTNVPADLIAYLRSKGWHK